MGLGSILGRPSPDFGTPTDFRVSGQKSNLDPSLGSKTLPKVFSGIKNLGLAYLVATYLPGNPFFFFGHIPKKIGFRFFEISKNPDLFPENGHNFSKIGRKSKIFGFFLESRDTYESNKKKIRPNGSVSSEI